MPNPEIEQFAKMLIQRVRDVAIEECDRSLRPGANYAIAKRWRTVLASRDAELIARVLIPDIVDSTLTHFCRAIDDESLRLTYTTENGISTKLANDGLGELAGWYIGTDSWRAWYSKERFFDDFSDLAKLDGLKDVLAKEKAPDSGH